MFSLAHYEAVAQAYLRGLKRKEKPYQISSVASFFSRVDTEVDRALEAIDLSPDSLRAVIPLSKPAHRRYDVGCQQP
jgi:hypothetical protein